jgi:hypothetical protein
MGLSTPFVTARAGAACLLLAGCSASAGTSSPKPSPSPSATAALEASPSPSATPSSTPIAAPQATAPPTLTALCAPNSTEFAWQVTSQETLSNYNVDLSINASASFPIEETSALQPYTFDTPNAGAYTLIQTRWDSTPAMVSDGTEANRERCTTPTLTVTTTCAILGALPDGGVTFTGGVEGMLFEMYGPETKGSFPSLGPLSTDANGDGSNGSLDAGAYEYGYVAPGSGSRTIDGSFTIAECPPA